MIWRSLSVAVGSVMLACGLPWLLWFALTSELNDWIELAQWLQTEAP